MPRAMNFSGWLKENAGWISLAGVAVSVLSATFSGFTLYFNFLADPDVTAEVGQVVLLNRKPFVGLNVTLRNSGAEQAVVNRGTLMFNTTELKLVMESIEPATWTYGNPSNDTPAKFTFLAVASTAAFPSSSRIQGSQQMRPYRTRRTLLGPPSS